MVKLYIKEDNIMSTLLLFILCITDLSTGILKSFVLNESFSSSKLTIGIIKKVVYLSLITIANFVSYQSGDSSITNMFITYFSVTESLSIIQNVLKIRPDLKGFLDKIKKGVK